MFIQPISVANFSHATINKTNNNFVGFKPSFKANEDEFVSSSKSKNTSFPLFSTPKQVEKTLYGTEPDQILTEGAIIMASAQKRVDEVDELLAHFLNNQFDDFFNAKDGITRDFVFGKDTHYITEHNHDGILTSLIKIDSASGKVISIEDYTDEKGEQGRKIQSDKNWISVTPNFNRQETGIEPLDESYVFVNGELLWNQQYFRDSNNKLMEKLTFFENNEFTSQRVKPLA